MDNWLAVLAEAERLVDRGELQRAEAIVDLAVAIGSLREVCVPSAKVLLP